jgi:hypothetical protein
LVFLSVVNTREFTRNAEKTVFMTEEEYVNLRARLISDFLAWFGLMAYQFFLFVCEWALKFARYSFPFILKYLQTKGYISDQWSGWNG